MATYVVTLKHGFGKTGKAQTENRTVKVIAPDSKNGEANRRNRRLVGDSGCSGGGKSKQNG